MCHSHSRVTSSKVQPLTSNRNRAPTAVKRATDCWHKYRQSVDKSGSSNSTRPSRHTYNTPCDVWSNRAAIKGWCEMVNCCGNSWAPLCRSHNNKRPCLLSRYKRPARGAAIAKSTKSGDSRLGPIDSNRMVSDRVMAGRIIGFAFSSCTYSRKLCGPLRRSSTMNRVSPGNAENDGGGGEGLQPIIIDSGGWCSLDVDEPSELWSPSSVAFDCFCGCIVFEVPGGGLIWLCCGLLLLLESDWPVNLVVVVSFCKGDFEWNGVCVGCGLGRKNCTHNASKHWITNWGWPLTVCRCANWVKPSIALFSKSEKKG